MRRVLYFRHRAERALSFADPGGAQRSGYYRPGEHAACEQVLRFRQQLARTLATVVNLIDPGVIVLGGGLSNVALLVNDLEADVAPLVFTDHFITPIVPARHGDSSGMRGAAWLAVRSGVENETFTD